MTTPSHIRQVGAPDPERRNSPIIEDTDEEFNYAGQELSEAPRCYFNDVAFPVGEFVCSGSEMLQKQGKDERERVPLRSTD